MISVKEVFTSVTATVFVSVLAFGFATPVFAEDLSDESCLECHDDADRTLLSNPDRPQVHNPAGGFFVQDHADFEYIDRHTFIEDLEHEETAPGQEVDCLECHDEVPAIE